MIVSLVILFPVMEIESILVKTLLILLFEIDWAKLYDPLKNRISRQMVLLADLYLSFVEFNECGFQMFR